MELLRAFADIDMIKAKVVTDRYTEVLFHYVSGLFCHARARLEGTMLRVSPLRALL